MVLNYSLYLILDDTHCSPHHMGKIIDAVSSAGITCLQLRMKQASAALIMQTAKQLMAQLPPHIPLIINDYPEIAAAINAAGVHLGQSDCAYAQARAILGPDKIIGLSIENEEQARQCASWPVDYFGVGPIFTTTTKGDAALPIGVKRLPNLVQLLPKPVVAIGGIDLCNLNEVLQSGVNGVAIAAAILTAPQPTLITQQFAHNITLYRAPHVVY